jgi:hypothetical protein
MAMTNLGEELVEADTDVPLTMRMVKAAVPALLSYDSRYEMPEAAVVRVFGALMNSREVNP